MTDDRPLLERLGEDNISDAALFREFGDIPATPALEKVVRRAPATGASYEEANWAKLSPTFRAAHNRLRRMRGLPSLPEPVIDLYVPPPAQIRPLDLNDARAAMREFVGNAIMADGAQGFTINGKEIGASQRRAAPTGRQRTDEGFTINGRSMR